jgi:hypothetical protein
MKRVMLDACRDPIRKVCPNLAGKKLSFTKIVAGAIRDLCSLPRCTLAPSGRKAKAICRPHSLKSSDFTKVEKTPARTSRRTSVSGPLQYRHGSRLGRFELHSNRPPTVAGEP